MEKCEDCQWFMEGHCYEGRSITPVSKESGCEAWEGKVTELGRVSKTMTLGEFRELTKELSPDLIIQIETEHTKYDWLDQSFREIKLEAYPDSLLIIPIIRD